MDPATVKFEQALTFILLPVSSNLAALHASRTRLDSQYSCCRCGSDLTIRTRIVRSKQNPRPSRAIAASCYACGAAISTPIEKGEAVSFPPRKRRSVNAQAVLPAPSPPTCDQLTALPSNTKLSDTITPVSSSPKIAIPFKNRPPQGSSVKKSSTLQEMLQRNREKEKKRTNTEEAKPTGLSAFLSTL
ncbi:hypothetical protein BDZ97DRAFT_28525 [Flammula alnicola]|nr:hypothetical protein BDZ97DRAFT_28525 [Flammula alnicola]